jgi:hypothetical protein
METTINETINGLPTGSKDPCNSSIEGTEIPKEIGALTKALQPSQKNPCPRGIELLNRLEAAVM